MNLISLPRLLGATALLLVCLAAAGCRTTDAVVGDPIQNSVDGPATVAPVATLRHQPGPPPQRKSLFDLNDPQVKNLNPALLLAVEKAARAARADGVELSITSGWRSREHQQRLFDEAVARYGSVDAASRLVSTPDKSAHVRGDAVDIGAGDADSWLSQHGADYGMCQIFANERWHFELAVAPGGTCPAPLPDSSYR